MDLRDLAFDGKLAALLFELPGGFHQLAFVDLLLGLRRVEQRRRRERVRALAPRLRFTGSGSGSGSGARDRRRRLRATTAGVGRAVRPQVLARRARGAARYATASSAGAACRPGLMARLFFVCFAITSLPRLVLRGARPATRGTSRAPRADRSATIGVAAGEHPAERELRRQDHRQHHQREHAR